jgi:predicted ester cyclase
VDWCAAKIEAMESDANKELIRSWIAFANAGFQGSFDRFVAGDFIGHLGAGAMDRVELERLERQFYVAFPDAHYTIDDLIAEGDRVALRTTTRATHQGEFEGIPPTGRAVEFTGLVIYRIAGEKIVESWGEIDFLRLIRELGRP